MRVIHLLLSAAACLLPLHARAQGEMCDPCGSDDQCEGDRICMHLEGYLSQSSEEFCSGLPGCFVDDDCADDPVATACLAERCVPAKACECRDLDLVTTNACGVEASFACWTACEKNLLGECRCIQCYDDGDCPDGMVCRGETCYAEESDPADEGGCGCGLAGLDSRRPGLPGLAFLLLMMAAAAATGRRAFQAARR